MLGPLEARVGGLPVGLGGPKQRALVALLLLQANDVVPLDRLIDELWEGAPPPSAPAYVQNCVSRLRKLLGAETFETRAPGYRLRIDPDAIDAGRFERLVREARGMPTRERASALREALALWAGTPLSDLAYWSFAQDPIRRLEEQRLTALEMRLEAELELGLHRESIGELDALAREHPTHERLRWLQMLALHRSDRRLDALAAYQEARLAIVEESGMEPGEELRALQRRILQDDPTLMPGGKAHTATAEPKLQLARRVVTVCILELLVDDDLDVEAARGDLSRGLATLEEIVRRHGGIVEQLLGEEALAVFGLPTAHEDDALRALRSAVELRHALVAPSLRAAVESGGILVDEDGRLLSGGALTVARRLKEHAGDGEILLGPAIAAQTAGATWTEPSDGGHRLVELVEGAPAIARRPDAPLVGRRIEFERLLVAVRESAASGSCRRVVVLGEPGIGKTRLAAELVRVVGDGVRVLTGRCVPYAEGATYLPLAEVVAQIVGENEREAAIRSLLAGEDDGAQAATGLHAALSGSSAVDSGDVFWATRKLLERIAREQPLLVVIEDVHWAEPTFLDLVEYLVGWSTGAPIALVCLARTELLDARPAWAADTIALGPLTADETENLLRALPEALALEGDARVAVVAAAEGNPLFAEQLAAHALDGPLEAGRVPASLESLLASRLDTLPPRERSVLERAAIVGREFTRSAVDALSPGEGRGSATALLALVRRRLVLPDAVSAGDDAFLFDHALIRDATYAAVSKAERARLHEQLARWLERRGELDEVVGHHLEQAVENRRATGQETDDLAAEAGECLARAGERAAWSMDHQAAIRLLERAAALLPQSDTRRLRAECVLGFALKSIGEWRMATDLLRATVQRAEQVGDRKHASWALAEQLWLAITRGTVRDYQLAAAVDEAIRLAAADRDPLVMARAHDAMFMLDSYTGRFGAALGDIRAAAEAYEEYGLRGFKDPMLVMYALEGPEPLTEVIELCGQRLAAVGAPRWRDGYLLVTRAEAEAHTGEFERAGASLEQARSRLLETGQAFAIQTMWTYVASGNALMAGDATAATEVLLPAVDQARARDDRHWLTHLVGRCSEAALLEGDLEAGLRLASEARTLAADPGDIWGSYAWRSALVPALLVRGDVEKAQDEVRTETERWEATDALIVKGRLRLLLAEALAAAGRLAEAADVAEESVRLLEQKGAKHLAGLARMFVAETAKGGARR